MTNIADIHAKAAKLRAELIDTNDYSLETVEYLLDKSKVQDDGFDSLETHALTVLKHQLKFG